MQPINLGIYRPKTTMTFREFVETQWQPNLFPTFKHSTSRGYAYLLRKYLLPYFGQIGQRLSSKSVALVKNCLSRVFSTAIEWGYIEQNPATGVRLPARISKHEAIALTPDQIQRLTAELREPCKSMVLIAVLTGMRRGELFALRWSAIDFEQKLIHVRESVYDGHFSSPKTRSSFRKIPMSEALEQVFISLKRTDAASENLVFASKNGKTPLRPENILKRIIHPACQRLGLPKVGWHDLRHTSATGLHQHEPLRVAQEILGHSDLQTTLGYTHALDTPLCSNSVIVRVWEPRR